MLDARLDRVQYRRAAFVGGDFELHDPGRRTQADVARPLRQIARHRLEILVGQQEHRTEHAHVTATITRWNDVGDDREGERHNRGSRRALRH